MAQLIIQTSAPVTVAGDEPTVILDWVNIASLGGFTLIITEVGGGDGNEINDVLVDTSNDGGTTSNLDQHPDLFTYPITSGPPQIGSFSETASYIRVRASGPPETTTLVTAILLADSAVGVGGLCLLGDVKDRLGLGSKTDFDSVINGIIVSVENIFNSYLQRILLLTSDDVTEYYTTIDGQERLRVNRYPIVSITSIKEAADYNFDAVDPLVVNTDYRIIAGGIKGIIYRVNVALLSDQSYEIDQDLGQYWLKGDDAIQIIYRGGFCPVNTTPGAGETPLPADLREAAIMQSSFVFKRKDDIGLHSVSAHGGSISKFADIELLPMVKQILDTYKRIFL
jgi:hypothetical protein